jgi:hypothetical protein
MHPAFTELMARDRATELQRTSDRVVLPDGRRMALRPLRRADRTGLAGLLARLGSGSRRRRSLATKSRLSADELNRSSTVG